MQLVSPRVAAPACLPTVGLSAPSIFRAPSIAGQLICVSQLLSLPPLHVATGPVCLNLVEPTAWEWTHSPLSVPNYKQMSNCVSFTCHEYQLFQRHELFHHAQGVLPIFLLRRVLRVTATHLVCRSRRVPKPTFSTPFPPKFSHLPSQPGPQSL